MEGEYSSGSPLADTTPARPLRDMAGRLPFLGERIAVLLQRVPGRAEAHRWWVSGARVCCLAHCCMCSQAALWPGTTRNEP